jgi:hypothetical protein
MHDYNKADLDDQTRGTLDFAVSLTRDPSANHKADIERLRSLDSVNSRYSQQY